MQAIQWTRTRERLNAMHTLEAIGAFGPAAAVSGWDYNNSVTLGEFNPGTAAKPNRVYWMTPGVHTNATKWIKGEVSWVGSKISRICYHYSDDNGATWTHLTDEFGNFVIDFTWSGDELQSAAWSLLGDHEHYLRENGTDLFIDESGTQYLVTEGN
ncbi:MAG: hypothetical protein RL409_929 [Gemmatimonadota bacterium]|jgi:hypothetical protein